MLLDTHLRNIGNNIRGYKIS